MGKIKNWAGFFLPWSQGETLNIRNLWNPRIAENHHLRSIPNTTGKAFEMPQKTNNLNFSFQEYDESVLSFPHCRLLLLHVFFARPLQRAGLDARAVLLTAAALCRGQMFWCWESRGAGTAPASPHHCMHLPWYTQPRRPTQHPRARYASAEMLVSSHRDTASLYALKAVLTVLTAEEGAELNMWADCCKLPGSGYKLKKPSEIKHKA